MPPAKLLEMGKNSKKYFKKARLKLLSPPVVPLYPFFGGGFPVKVDYRKKGSLILTSLLEDLDCTCWVFGDVRLFVFFPPLGFLRCEPSSDLPSHKKKPLLETVFEKVSFPAQVKCGGSTGPYTRDH